MAPEEPESARPEHSVSGDAKTIFRRAWKRRCPQCGAGELFATFTRLHADCGSCGLVFRREQGAMTGSMYLSAAVTQVFAALILLAVFVGTDWEPLTSIAVGLPLVIAFCVWFLPRSMALWVGVEYWTDVKNGERWARPRS